MSTTGIAGPDMDGIPRWAAFVGFATKDGTFVMDLQLGNTATARTSAGPPETSAFDDAPVHDWPANDVHKQ